MRLNNVLMQLRKCCNHPYLFEWPVDGAGNEVVDEILCEASGKMQLLDRILTQLKKEGGHQSLIFSQMTRMLDILEDYLTWKGWSYRRLDGTVAAADRLTAMNEFQDKDNEIDVFLLSTRAGGLGVNLTRADTVIIFDSDWNPHMDLQVCMRARTQAAAAATQQSTHDPRASALFSFLTAIVRHTCTTGDGPRAPHRPDEDRNGLPPRDRRHD